MLSTKAIRNCQHGKKVNDSRKVTKKPELGVPNVHQVNTNWEQRIEASTSAIIVEIAKGITFKGTKSFGFKVMH